jgi:hypothetical protein
LPIRPNHDATPRQSQAVDAGEAISSRRDCLPDTRKSADEDHVAHEREDDSGDPASELVHVAVAAEPGPTAMHI